MKSIIIDSSWYCRPPHVPKRLGAGGIVCLMKGKKIFLALAHEGDWPSFVIPKGGVDPGEHIEATARREIAEETGITKLRLLGKIGVLERLNFDRSNWMETHIFAYCTSQYQATPLDSRAHPQPPSWHPIDDIPYMLWPEQRQIVEKNKKLIKRWMINP